MRTDITYDMGNMDDAVRFLDGLADTLSGAVQKGVSRATPGIHRSVMDFLSGARGNPGDYPVPVRTGHLRRMLDFVLPGKSKQAGGLTFEAGDHEGIVFDSARYADVIKDGTHSSSAYGPRDYMKDGFEAFGGSARVAEFIVKEIESETGRL